MEKDLSLVAKGAGFYFAGFAVSKVLAYLYRILVARGLGPEVFGVFSIGVSIVGILTVFAAFGLYQGIMHFVARHNALGETEQTRGVIRFALKVQLILSIVFAIVLFFSSDWLAVTFFHNSELTSVLQLFSISLPFFTLTSSLMIVIIAFKKIEYKILIRNVLENIAKIGFTGILLLLGFGLFGAVVGIVLSIMVAFVLSLYFVQKKVFPIFGSGLKHCNDIKEVLSYSWPLLAVGFFSILMSSIDIIMLGHLSQAYDAGIYNVAMPTANLLSIAPFAFGSLFLPIITGLYAQKKMAEMKKMFKVVSRWIFSMIFPCLLFTVLFSTQILSVMFGDIYAPGASAMVILAVGVFMASFFGPVSSILESTKKTKIIFFNTAVCGVLNIFLNLWLIPLFEASGNAIIGAALATTISLMIWSLMAFIEVFVFTKLHPYSKAYIVPTFTACIAIALFFILKAVMPGIELFVFPLNFIVLAIFGLGFLCLYSLLFVVFRGLQSDDLDILRAVEKKTGIRINVVRNFVKRFI